MSSVFFPDIPETEPIWQRAAEENNLDAHHVGPYVELRFIDAITIDRHATGVRHAVWYSCVGALEHAHVAQFDKDGLRIVADNDS